MVDLKLHERSKEELYRLREQVKISNLTYNEKTMLIRDIEMHMGDVEHAKHRHIYNATKKQDRLNERLSS